MKLNKKLTTGIASIVIGLGFYGAFGHKMYKAFPPRLETPEELKASYEIEKELDNQAKELYSIRKNGCDRFSGGAEMRYNNLLEKYHQNLIDEGLQQKVEEFKLDEQIYKNAVSEAHKYGKMAVGTFLPLCLTGLGFFIWDSEDKIRKEKRHR